MMKLVNKIRAIRSNENGATAIEYGLIAALIAVAIIVGAGSLGTNLNNTFSNLSGSVGG